MHTAEHYLRDLFQLLIEHARETRAQRDAARHSVGARQSADRERFNFESGRTLGYYEVLTTMLSALDAFQLSREALNIPTDFNPDRDLV